MSNDDEFLKAAEVGDTARVCDLLDQVVQVDVINKNGETALMLASIAGHKEIVKLLIGKGADVNKYSMTKWNALCFAATRNHYDVVECLIEAGADINALCQNDCTVLEWVIRQQDNRKSMVRTLLDFGAEIRQRTLEIAKINSEDEILILLKNFYKEPFPSVESSHNTKTDNKKAWWKFWLK